MQSVSSRIWTRIAVFISYGDNDYTTGISTLYGRSLKLVDKFTYLGSSILSTENDINTRLAKAWTVIDRRSVIWKSNISDEIKHSVSQAAIMSMLFYGCITWTMTKHMEKKNLTAIAQELYWTNLEGSTPQKSSCTATDHPSRKPSKLVEQDMRNTTGEVKTHS